MDWTFRSRKSTQKAIKECDPEDGDSKINRIIDGTIFVVDRSVPAMFIVMHISL